MSGITPETEQENLKAFSKLLNQKEYEDEGNKEAEDITEMVMAIGITGTSMYKKMDFSMGTFGTFAQKQLVKTDSNESRKNF